MSEYTCHPGQKVGQLTILEELPRQRIYGRTARVLSVRCDCGTEKILPFFSVFGQGQKVKSCGCIFQSKRPVNWKGCGDLSGEFWGGIVKSAEIRGVEFNLTIEEAWSRFLAQDRCCALTGMQLIMLRTRHSKLDSREHTASLDRIDSSSGYTVNNIQWVHKMVNGLKGFLSNDEFIFWCQKVVSKHPEARMIDESIFRRSAGAFGYLLSKADH